MISIIRYSFTDRTKAATVEKWRHTSFRPDKLACMLDKQKKQKLIKKFQTHAGDTGSSEVQIAILSAEIDELAEHLQKNQKDHSSRRGLLRKVGERRRLLRFLKKENASSYEQLIKKLKLKQAKTLEKPDAEEALLEDSSVEDEQTKE